MLVFVALESPSVSYKQLQCFSGRVKQQRIIYIHARRTSSQQSRIYTPGLHMLGKHERTLVYGVTHRRTVLNVIK